MLQNPAMPANRYCPPWLNRLLCALTQLAVLASILSSSRLIAGNVALTFDDLIPFTQVGEQYAKWGFHFQPNDWEVVPGLQYGDPDGWEMEGSVGPYFMGFSSGSLSYLDFTSDSPMTSLSLDVVPIRVAAYGPWPLFMEFDTFNFGQITHTDYRIPLSSSGKWQTLSYTSPTPFNEFRFVAYADIANYDYVLRYGIDNIQVSLIPEPSTAGLSTLALASTAVTYYFRKRSRRSTKVNVAD